MRRRLFWMSLIALLLVARVDAQLEYVGAAVGNVTHLDTQDDGTIYMTMDGTGWGMDYLVLHGKPGDWQLVFHQADPIAEYQVVNAAEHYFMNGQGTLCRTVDAGVSYTTLTQPLTDFAIHEGHVAGVNGDRNVYTLNADGVTWSAEAVTSAPAALRHIASIEGDLLAYGGAQLFRRGALASQWQQLGTPTVGGTRELGLVFSHHGVLYCTVADSSAAEQACYASADLGQTWMQQTPTLTSPRNFAASGSNVVIVTASNAYIEYNASGVWHELGFSVSWGENINCGVLQGDELLLGVVDGLYRYKLPKLVRELEAAGPAPVNVTYIDAHNDGTIYLTTDDTISTTTGTMAYRVFGGKPGAWETLREGVEPIVDYQAVNALEHYCMGYKRGGQRYFLRTVDGGDSYTTLTKELSSFTIYHQRPVGVDGSNQVYTLNADGTAWSAQEVDPSTNHLSKITQNEADELFVDSGCQTFVYQPPGNRWQQVNTPGCGDEYGRGGFLSHRGSYYLFITSSIAIDPPFVVSEDFGLSWREHPYLDKPRNFTASGPRVLLITDRRAFMENKATGEWEDLGIYRKEADINCGVLRGNELLLGTGAGLYRLMLPNAATEWECYQ